ncbi:substrate-binding domain-containing protein [uncultured Sunxiuqinia sp.]|uniref:substrate-binding domain-containing protein n=1 Tax=uncultured Sunxiuqinia sp. TaxID=1573825 RepID=UPI002AA65BF5|nr:substrate-binding domain-containing protein [uncultured Sunxiuqinia sp.]
MEKKQANFLTRSKPEGNYVLIGGPTIDNNSVQLYLGWMNVLQPLVDKGDINIVSNTFVNEWNVENGYTVVKDLLDTDVQLDAIIAGNDALASGAIQALHENDLEGEVFCSRTGCRHKCHSEYCFWKPDDYSFTSL